MNPNVVKYDHQSVESKWQDAWQKAQLNVTDVNHVGKPFYNLMMFPYPSAEGLHVGNMYAFTGSDVYGRYKRLQGFTVFEPIGLDGFGIHSENYSIKIGRHPMEHAAVTEKNFYSQLHKIGAMFDWTKTVETYKPEYYSYTQWLFIQLFKRGLVYRGKAEVNWCPSCKTVLADEQVIDGKCERCGNEVIKKLLEQWFFKITAYAEKLDANIEALHWSEKVKVAQKNWIGKKEGIEIDYDIVQEDGKRVGTISCFTTRPDTNFGATFVAIAPEHPIISQLNTVIDEDMASSIKIYQDSAKKLTIDERVNGEAVKKTGVNTGLYCVNKLNNVKMPLYISDFVLMSFGTGAVVGVPAHDLRDYDFATTFNLPIIQVVVLEKLSEQPITSRDQVYEGEGVIINSEFLTGSHSGEAKEKIMDYLESKKWGRRVTKYHLRDWLISRQRYWGPPIPMIYCETCAKKGQSYFKKDTQDNSNIHLDAASLAAEMPGWYPVPELELPVTLPYIEDFKPGDDGIPPLQKHKEFFETVCPGCGSKAVRETEVSDTFLDSSWYFLRYPSVGEPTQSMPWNESITKQWLPVSMYTGGAEHSVLHLMYSRFVTMALHDMGYIDFDEPFSNFFAHGLVIKDGAKMSKSKGNVVNPDEYIKIYGSDALRLYLMFMGSYSDGGDFRDSAMEGMYRWVGRIWRMSQDVISRTATTDPSLVKLLHRLIKKVGEDIEKRHYNTAIAAMMEFTNAVSDQKNALAQEDLIKFLILLAPFAPHLTEELYQQIHKQTSLLKKTDSIHFQHWPDINAIYLVDDMVQIVIQVNGKVRDMIELSSDQASNQETVETEVKKRDKVKAYLDKATILKTIYVPRKIINFVIQQ